MNYSPKFKKLQENLNQIKLLGPVDAGMPASDVINAMATEAVSISEIFFTYHEGINCLSNATKTELLKKMFDQIVIPTGVTL